MAGADGIDGGEGEASGSGPYAAAPDARLTELLRADPTTAYLALQELRARHRTPVLAYARLCATSDSTARQLAAQAFTLAARETARGIDPGVPWRHRLLLLTVRVAASWATDERSAGLDASLLLVLNTTGADGPTPPLLGPFQSLPSRAQGLIWYGVLERESPSRTAGYLGLTREDVTYGTDQALQSMAQACLRSRLAGSDDPHCGDFRRLIEEAVRPDSPRESPDLHAHMAHCAHCTTAYEELSALRDAPRTALAEGLLPWAGPAYAAREGRAARSVESRKAPGTWQPSRRLVLTSAALGVAVAPLLLFLVTQGGGSAPQGSAGAAVTTPANPPPVTVTATVSATPSPSATSKSPSPSPTRSSPPPRTPTVTPTPTPSPFRPPGGTYAQVVNVASGRCLDVSGTFEKGTDVITAPCDTSSSQRWRVDADRGVLQSSADPDFCLDSRGDVDKGVGIWECESLDGSNGDNLRFTVDDDGVIRPTIAIATALTPVGGGLSLEPLSGGAGQRWRAGAG
ncbi:RICIN domain-containing protein [Streptomyces sp. NBC_01352]|uniref:RICIN domain-containing protein n=1 Tax=Streptomyces sp. NBC_01352 TaxID=2903834 RepID=UPI002E3782A7|nr:RICIN domain-containing protein [Streptomyces sp. NBC_01352]